MTPWSKTRSGGIGGSDSGLCPARPSIPTDESARVPASLPSESVGPRQCWFGQVTVQRFDLRRLSVAVSIAFKLASNQVAGEVSTSCDRHPYDPA
jgi:hypothetical protein